MLMQSSWQGYDLGETLTVDAIKKNMKKLPVGYSNKNFFQDKFYQLKILTGKKFDILVLSYWNKNWFKISKLSVSDRGVSMQKQPPEVFCKKGVFRNFTKFTGNHLC